MEEALQAAAEASGGDLTIEQVTKVTKLHEDQSAKMKEDAGDYLYNLAGILVHAGVAQGGHYYSYIRDRGKSAYEEGGCAGGGTGRRGDGEVATAAAGTATGAAEGATSINGGKKGAADGLGLGEAAAAAAVEAATASAAAAGGQVRLSFLCFLLVFA